MALLDARDVSVVFPTRRGPLTAVDGVTLHVDAGETLGIVGESGSGKSVLMRTVMNLLGPQAIVAPAAEIRFDGRDVRALSRVEARSFWGGEIAMIFQDPMTSLNPVKRIGAQIVDPIRHHLGLGRSAARGRALELLAQVGISDPRRRIDQYPHQLSGGMRQRVTIAIAISCNPRMVIADEPTTALDVTVQKQILDLLAGLQRDLGMAMIMVTHDLGVVARYADRIAVMYAGRIVDEADASTLFEEMRHPYPEALLRSIPRTDAASHTLLDAISGRPPDMVDPPAGCRFAPRCRSAQTLCLTDDPVLHDVDEPSIDHADHRVACHFPCRTPDGEHARQANIDAGTTAAGLSLLSGDRAGVG